MRTNPPIIASKPENRGIGFPYIASPDARLLILGSVPSVRSVKQAEYYAHPKNVFWPIIFSILGRDDVRTADYETKINTLKTGRIALWDVVFNCTRTNSSDSSIQTDTVQVNDFAELFLFAPRIQTVVFNSKSSHQLFRRFVPPNTAGLFPDQQLILPSTSPAHAALSYAQKLAAWQQIKFFLT